MDAIASIVKKISDGTACEESVQPVVYIDGEDAAGRRSNAPVPLRESNSKRQVVSYLVVNLLKVLYKDLLDEEKKVREPNGESKEIHGLLRELYFENLGESGEPCRSRLVGPVGNGAIRLVGPVGERPIHVCFLRAGHFPAIDGFKEGVLDGIREFAELECVGADPLPKGEIDAPFGKDYCAAVISLVRSPRFLSGLQAETGADAGAWMTSLPFFLALQAWAGRPQTRRGVECAGGVDDAEMLEACGLYEGETPLVMSIANRSPGMVRWLLDNQGARCRIRIPSFFIFFASVWQDGCELILENEWVHVSCESAGAIFLSCIRLCSAESVLAA